jgi:predicted acylesterase/phospholipase RssA
VTLLRSGAVFDIVCGTSIGAINADFIAMNAIDELQSVWRRRPTHR